MAGNIWDYIDKSKGNFNIAYITRSYIGTWSITYHLDPKGSVTSEVLSSYGQLSDLDLGTLREMGFELFDFKDLQDSEKWADNDRRREAIDWANRPESVR